MAIVTTSQNLSALTYAQAETITIRNGATLTVTATPATRPGTIQCITSGKLRIENSSATVPLIFDLHDMDNDFQFEANGVLEIRGAPMPLGTGTGAAQSWDFSTLFGGVIRHMTYVEVEETAGSGVYMPWPVIHDDPKFILNAGIGSGIGGSVDFQAGNTAAGQVLFWHETNRILRCGDNTNGRAIPTGCAVRIPNIYISNRLQTNQTRTLSINTTGTPTGGTFTLQIHRENGTLIGTTAAIAFNATAAAIDTAIEAVTGAGTVTSGGGPLPTIVQVTWAGIYAAERLGIRVATNSLTGGTNPLVRCFDAAVNLSIIDLNPLGTLDAEWCAFSEKIRIAVDVFKSVRLISVGTSCDGIRFDNTNGSIEIDGLAMQQSPFCVDQSNRISSVLGQVSLRRVVGAKKATSQALELNNLPGLSVMDRIVGMIYGKRSATGNRAITLGTLAPNVTYTNITAVGAGIGLTNLSGAGIVGYSYADGTTATQDLTQAQSVITTTNCANLTLAGYTDAGPQVHRNNLVQTDAQSSNIKLLGGTSAGASQTSIVVSMQASGLEASNISISGLRDGPVFDLPGNYLANGLKARKVFCTFGTAQVANGLDACQGGQYDLVSSTINGITETFSGVNDFVGGNYADPSLTPTTGHATFGPFGAGAGLDLTGAAFTDALGGVLLPAAGDTATVTMPFPMHGITGFQNVEPRLYVDAPGVISNVAIVGNPGAPTGGTFTVSVFDAAGTLLGTTPAQAFNVATAALDTAIEAIPGVGAGVGVGGAMATGYVITFPVGQLRRVTVDGSLLTGGAEPGIAYAVGRARLLDGTETLGSITTAEFACRVPGTAWPAYASLTGANLAGAIAALTGYAPGGSGLEMRLRLTAGQTNPFTKFNQISLPTSIAPTLWSVGDATITLNGPAATDITRVVRVSDGEWLYSFTGGGTKEFAVGANYNTEVYFLRENIAGLQLMITSPTTQRLRFGVNPAADLYYGAEVQLAQAPALAALDALIQSRLDVAVSTREAESAAAARAATNQAEHDATQVAVAGVSGGGGGLDAAGVRAALGMAAANLDAQLADLPSNAELSSALSGLPAAPSAATVAGAVRTELATELGRLDAAVSSRAAPGAAMALTAGERTSVASTVEQSILNEGDGQQVLNAIVGAIGNTNVDQVALVAAVRADLERAGGTLATRASQASVSAIPTAAAPTAAANAAAVRTELATEMDRIDVAVSTRLATAGYTAPAAAPTAAANAAAVRAEIATELGRLDVAVSTREAESAAATRAATDQAEHDATQAALAALPAAPSASAVATAVLAAAQAAPIAANVERMNGAEVIGDGTAGNAWRGVGVPG